MPTINTRFEIKSTESPIFFKSIESIKNIIQNIYGEEISVLGVSQDSDINRELGRVTQDLKNKSYCNILLKSLEEDKESYNGFSLMKYAHEPVYMKDNYWYLIHLRPVLATFSIKFFNQDYSKILKFMSSWIFNKREATFTLKNNAFSVDIKVSLNNNISSSEKDFSEGNPFSVSTELTMKTYVGDIYRCANIDKLEQKTILNSFEIEGI